MAICNELEAIRCRCGRIRKGDDMMRSVIRLGGYRLQALNGDRIGRVHDFLFDDRIWTIRYLVLRTGGLLSRRKKLVSPVALGEPDWSSRTIPVMLSVKQVVESPDISIDKPVSLQREIERLREEGLGLPSHLAG